jgi:hypothetical protein
MLRPWILVGLLGGCGFTVSAGATDAAIDAASDGDPDSSIDASATCPSTYVGQYRLELTARTWLDAEATCERDAPGLAHLVVIDDDAERSAVSDLVQMLPGDAWVGIVRDPGGPPWEWRYVTGGAATYAPFEGSEPNNMSGDQLTVVMRRSSRYLYDYGVGQLVSAVCECDGRPTVNADFDPATN